MITKERLKLEIDKVQDDYIDILFNIIKTLEYAPFTHQKTSTPLTTVVHDVSTQDWLGFIETTYGSLGADPIARGDQGSYDLRENIV